MLYKDKLDYDIIRNTYSITGIPVIIYLNNEIHYIETMQSTAKHYCFREDDHSVQLNDINMKILSVFKMRNKIYFITEDGIYVYNRNKDVYTKILNVSLTLSTLENYSIKSLVVNDKVYITIPVLIDNNLYTNIYRINPYIDTSWSLYKTIDNNTSSEYIDTSYISTELIYIWGKFYYLNNNEKHLCDIDGNIIINKICFKMTTFHDKIILLGIKDFYRVMNSDYSYTTYDDNFSIDDKAFTLSDNDRIYTEVNREFGSTTSRLLISLYQEEYTPLLSYFDTKKYNHIKSGTTDLTYDENVIIPGTLNIMMDNGKNYTYLNPELYCDKLSLMTLVNNNISKYNMDNIKFMTVYNNTLFIICRSKYYYQVLDGTNNLVKNDLSLFNIPEDEVSDAFSTCGNKLVYAGRDTIYLLDMDTLKSNTFKLPDTNTYTSVSAIDDNSISIYFEFIENNKNRKGIYTYNLSLNKITSTNKEDKTDNINISNIYTYTNSYYNLLPKEKNEDLKFYPYILKEDKLIYSKYLNIILVLDMTKGIIYGTHFGEDLYIFMPLCSLFNDCTVDLFFTDEVNRKIYILKDNKLYSGNIEINW